MLLPADYDDGMIAESQVRELIERMAIIHGGPEYDALYPDGIPTSVSIDHATFGRLESGLVRHPLGHAQSDPAETARFVETLHKLGAKVAIDDFGAGNTSFRALRRLGVDMRLFRVRERIGPRRHRLEDALADEIEQIGAERLEPGRVAHPAPRRGRPGASLARGAPRPARDHRPGTAAARASASSRPMRVGMNDVRPNAPRPSGCSAPAAS